MNQERLREQLGQEMIQGELFDLTLYRRLLKRASGTLVKHLWGIAL